MLCCVDVGQRHFVGIVDFCPLVPSDSLQKNTAAHNDHLYLFQYDHSSINKGCLNVLTRKQCELYLCRLSVSQIKIVLGA